MNKVQANNLPAELRESGLFCCWRYETRPGTDKSTKVPYNPRTGGGAQSTNPGTFAPLSATLEAAERGQYDGIGAGIFGSLGAIDIDHCLDDNGRPSELARDIAGTIHGYTERSPSGKGLRILFTVSDGFQYDKARYYINNQRLGLEVYIAGATQICHRHRGCHQPRLSPGGTRGTACGGAGKVHGAAQSTDPHTSNTDTYSPCRIG